MKNLMSFLSQYALAFITTALAGVLSLLKPFEGKDGAFYSAFNWVLAELKNELIFVLIGLALFNLVTIYVDKLVNRIWDKEIKDSFLNAISEIKDELFKKHKSERFERYIENLSRDEAKEYLAKITGHAYGKHCLDQKSLAHALKDRIFPHLEDKKPFRADYRRNITISKIDNDHLMWDETATYRIRCIALDNLEGSELDTATSTCLPYEIKYRTNIEIEKALNKVELSRYRILINQESECIFDSVKDLDLEDDLLLSRNKFAKATADGKYIDISFTKTINIKKPRTIVTVTENTPLLSKDNYVVINTSVPVRGAYISISLPEGWNFKEYSMPDKNLWLLPEQDITQSNKLIVQTDDWLFPGVLFIATWERK